MPLRPTVFFYLGLLPVITLLWAWADSATNNTVWSRKLDADRSFTIAIAQSRIRTGTITKTESFSGPRSQAGPAMGSFARASLTPSRSLRLGQFFPPIEREDGGRRGYTDYHFQLLHLPFWLILAAYLPPWLALSYYYARRRRKLHLASLPHHPPPGSSHSDP